MFDSFHEMMFSRASACPRQITCKVSKRVVQVSWAPTHANSMALLVPVYSVATRFHFLVFLQKSYWVLEIDFLQLSLESDSVGNGACCLCSWVRSWALNSQTLICWIPKASLDHLRSGDAQAAAPAPMWWRWRCGTLH